MEQLKTFLEVVGLGRGDEETLREDVESLVTSQRHQRDRIYEELRDRLLASVGGKQIYSTTRRREKRVASQDW